MKEKSGASLVNHPAKILVLQTAFLGDVILVTSLIRVVRQRFPETEIHFLTIPASQNVVENSPFINRLWIFDKRKRDSGIRGIFRLAALLRQERFDIALVPHRSLRSAALVYLAGIPIRIGFNRSSGSFLFTRLAKYEESHHELERNLALLQMITAVQNVPPLPDIFPDETDRRMVGEWFTQENITQERPLISLAPGSIWYSKRWPALYWRELISLLIRDGFTMVLIGSKSDRELSAEISQGFEYGVHNAGGIFTLRQSAEIIRRSRLLISNDSAPTHIGVAARTPVLTIFGSTVPGFGFYPFGSVNRVAEILSLDCRPCTDHGKQSCPRGHFKCMNDLKPAMICSIVGEMIHADPKN